MRANIRHCTCRQADNDGVIWSPGETVRSQVLLSQLVRITTLQLIAQRRPLLSSLSLPPAHPVDVESYKEHRFIRYNIDNRQMVIGRQLLGAVSIRESFFVSNNRDNDNSLSPRDTRAIRHRRNILPQGRTCEARNKVGFSSFLSSFFFCQFQKRR